MDNPIEEVVERVVALANGIRASAVGFTALAVVGSLLATIAMVRWSVTPWIIVIVALVLAFPAVVLWRFRDNLRDVVDLPQRMQDAPGISKEAKRSLQHIQSSASEGRRSIVGLARLARDLRNEVSDLESTDMGQAVAGLKAVHPARLAAGASAAGFALGSLVFGLILIVASLFVG
ncbi:MAG: hypothetical protein HKN26_04715 [Acidimicrobiales bacterium]|nr:hypothetical protein [Acidimicrobiales bacterium]